jgi:nicotinamide phosphoribosyltransferase
MLDNLILATDSYKLTHYNQYPEGTKGVYSYLEARHGAEYPYTVFFGLQSILKQIARSPITSHDIAWASAISEAHFGSDDLFNLAGWQHILNKHNGRLPLRIKAVPEGTVVPNGNVLMTVENTDPECYWLTNALESLLLHVWYPTTVATRSYAIKEDLRERLQKSADTLDALPFMLHDFGYRGATTTEAAAIGGAAHLVNFMGTDTLPAMQLLLDDYKADLGSLAFSVPATEHSVMTAQGKAGERAVVKQLLDKYPSGILSCVADSYNIYRFVEELCTVHKDRIMARDGKFVVRPDSCTAADPTPESLVVTLVSRLWASFGGTFNSKGFAVLDPHVGMIWGDGIEHDGILRIADALIAAGFSVENIVFGMGGGLLQKLNRDTQRFAFKCSAQKRLGHWLDVQKKPLDATKTSKKGRLMLGRDYLGNLATVPEGTWDIDELQLVFYNGELLNETTLDQVRACSQERYTAMTPA